MPKMYKLHDCFLQIAPCSYHSLPNFTLRFLHLKNHSNEQLNTDMLKMCMFCLSMFAYRTDIQLFLIPFTQPMNCSGSEGKMNRVSWYDLG